MIPMAAQDILQEESPGVDKRGGREEERRREETFMLVSASLKLPRNPYGLFIFLWSSAVIII